MNRRTPLAMTSVAVLLVTVGCSSTPSRDASVEKSSSTAVAGKKPAATKSSTGPNLDLNCVFEHLQNPPESFHYVYKKDGDNKVHQEADVTPQAIDGFRMQPDGSQQPIRAARSDPQEWRMATAGLTGISGMASTVSTFRNTSAMQHESDGGPVNGYDATHYSIDTARWDETTRQMLGNATLGPGGFDKGDVWVAPDGCPVKFVLDEEMHKKDGSLLQRVHYEESMQKK
jgi:hypothetical protein